jgi:hypothetical protein
MNRQEIEALPNDPTNLKRLIVQQADIIASHEAAKAQRTKDAAIASTSMAATFELDVFTTKAGLEGLADGSEDITDPIRRGEICRGAIGLINRLFKAVPKD